jgi:3',5'-cyclic AMP phosphodiesterase CpdA
MNLSLSHAPGRQALGIVQISDTHLSHRGGVTNHNCERLIRFINEDLRPDLVVHTGDVSMLDPDSAADRDTARGLLGRINAPLRVLPGNHDVGEPGERAWGGLAVTSERVTAFTGVFGADHWIEVLGDYAVIGLNSEILSTGLPEEHAQWDWLETITDQVGARQALVFCHKPFWPPVPGPTEVPLSVPDGARDRLLRALDGVNVKVYGSGHLHRFEIGQHGEGLRVIAPSTAAVSRDRDELVGTGLRQLGLVEYRCEAGDVDVYFRSVPGLVEGAARDIEQFTLTAQDMGVAL